ncbi:protein of unknown function [Hyphomicrobium sp. MC1]|nr:protein of unknown function [Hyphomicrobium sp. MC1]
MSPILVFGGLGKLGLFSIHAASRQKFFREAFGYRQNIARYSFTTIDSESTQWSAFDAEP